jgi:hypothetical protein
MTLMRIRLELGRTSEAPSGDSHHGYELIMPLNAQGHVEVADWEQQKAHCGVRSFRPGHPDRHGMLKRSGRGWYFDYDPRQTKDDEPFFRLERHVISPDLYVTITEEDGRQRPFRIVAVSPVENAA